MADLKCSNPNCDYNVSTEMGFCNKCGTHTIPPKEHKPMEETAVDTLRDLERKLNAATGPDRELDCHIWAHFNGYSVEELDNGLIIGTNIKPPHETIRFGFIDPGIHRRNFSIEPLSEKNTPLFTASLDACIALCSEVLPGHALSIGTMGFDPKPDKPWAIIWDPYARQTNTSGPTPALALLIAIVKVLLSQHETKEPSP